MIYHSVEEFTTAVMVQHDSYSLRDRWVVGGQTGGSCWDEGSSNYWSVATDDEPEQDVLDDIIDMAMPDLTFREYRVIQKAGVYDYSRHTENEYYGNYTEYRIRDLNLAVLFETLQDIKAERQVALEREAAGLA